MITQFHQTSCTLTIGAYYFSTRHSIFVFRNNNLNYIVFLGNFLRRYHFGFHYIKLRKFWNFLIKNFLNKLTCKITIWFSLFIFRVQSINKICRSFCYKLFSNQMKIDCRPINHALFFTNPTWFDWEGCGTSNESIFSFSWHFCNCLRYFCSILMSTSTIFSYHANALAARSWWLPSTDLFLITH